MPNNPLRLPLTRTKGVEWIPIHETFLILLVTEVEWTTVHETYLNLRVTGVEWTSVHEACRNSSFLRPRDPSRFP